MVEHRRPQEPGRKPGGNGLHLYRIFGDVNGDGTVDATDVGQLKLAFNSGYDPTNPNSLYQDYLDADIDGSIDANDVGQFKGRFNQNVFI